MRRDGCAASADPATSATAKSSGHVLRIWVADDGVGGADPGRGSGLVGLGDRLETLNGRLQVNSPAGGGTRVQAELPLG